MSVAPSSWHYDWYVTLHNTKRQNTELQIGSTQKQKRHRIPNPVGVKLARRLRLHVSSLGRGRDKSRTGLLKEANHLTTFNNTVLETDVICLADEEPSFNLKYLRLSHRIELYKHLGKTWQRIFLLLKGVAVRSKLLHEGFTLFQDISKPPKKKIPHALTESRKQSPVDPANHNPVCDSRQSAVHNYDYQKATHLEKHRAESTSGPFAVQQHFCPKNLCYFWHAFIPGLLSMPQKEGRIYHTYETHIIETNLMETLKITQH